MSKVLQQNQDGSWSEAKPLPYYPSIWETIGHWFGVHQWTYGKNKVCVMCGKSLLSPSTKERQT